MSEILESRWVIEHHYFHVRLVDDFERKYLKWYVSTQCGKVDDSVTKFINSIKDRETIEIYKFPTASKETVEMDFFELNDDNFAIPFHLFELV